MVGRNQHIMATGKAGHDEYESDVAGHGSSSGRRGPPKGNRLEAMFGSTELVGTQCDS